jgi:nuclear transport factor 2 (NTF2) superfamily protein
MRRREASINDIAITEADRFIHGPRGLGEAGRPLPIP